MKDLRVNTPFGQSTVTEDMGDSVQVMLDFPHKDGNRDCFLWIFDESEITYL